MSNENIVIGGVEKFTTIDYPGYLSAVIFMKGCPLKCPYCHNTHLQQTSKETDIDWQAFIEFLNSRSKLLDAVVFSGGEPLLQNCIKSAIKEVKDLGFKIGLHTSGVNPKLLSEIIADVDWVGLDVKAPFDNYTIATGGVEISEKVKESIKIITASNTEIEVRTTLDPTILKIEDIYKISDEIYSLGVKNFALQEYRSPNEDDLQNINTKIFFEDIDLIHHLRMRFNLTVR